MARTAPTYDEFVALYPAFASTVQPRIESFLSMSSRLLDEASWGDFFSDAVGLDAAHSLALALGAEKGPQAALQGATGPISSVSAAGISTSFNTMSSDGKSKSDNWYSKTVYGQQFLRLRDTVIPPGVMV